jgi:hypothetical protein
MIFIPMSGVLSTEYEIDLTAEHAQALREALARYVRAARPAGAVPGGQPGTDAGHRRAG